MSTIRERCDKWMEVNRGCFTQIQDALIKFATAERELQRQECAEALWKAYEETSIAETAYGMTIRGRDAILTAGTEKPQNPFGCGCWENTDQGDYIRKDEWSFYHLAPNQQFCQWCGAKRREQ